MIGNRVWAILGIALSTTACETTGGAIATGAGTGAVAGAGMGALARPSASPDGRIRDIVIGSTLGAVAGAAGGYIVHREIKDGEDEAFAKGKKAGLKDAETATTGEEPVLLPPRVEAHFVPDQVRGQVFVPAHYEYRIVEQARWSK